MLSVDDDLDTDNKIKLYPNPANNSITFKGDISNYSVKMFDINGRQIKSINSNIQNEYDISTLSTGMYIIQLLENSTNKISIFKLIKN
ncbi:T9SS type A sorting domain-containing protein [Psychroserpens sp.]